MVRSLVDVSTVRPSFPSSIFNYYRCAEVIPNFGITGNPKGSKGFFQFGSGVTCYGRVADGKTTSGPNGVTFDAYNQIRFDGNTILLPFDVDKTVDNLRFERYVTGSGWQRWVQESWVADVYYGLRPMFPVSFRKHLQKAYLKDWQTLQFPNWPVDRNADLLLEKLVVLGMQVAGLKRLPFVWFWPRGHKACAIVTHDVETRAGRDFCGRLMDIDEEFGIKSSFQVVPEKRYVVSNGYLESMRTRGFEVNIHGLNHDGNLFRGRQTFLERARQINRYAEQFGAHGFRSPVLYRNADWFQDLNFAYDMSTPNVARLEPQRGGCCTVMPYFLPGGMLELPLTLTEDYSLFHILQDYSTTLWKEQMNAVYDGHGLISVLVHPDYIMSDTAQRTYSELLEEISRYRLERDVWLTLPGEVNRWWRERRMMSVVVDGDNWRIEGAGNERARLAYICLDGDQLSYELEPERC